MKRYGYILAENRLFYCKFGGEEAYIPEMPQKQAFLIINVSEIACFGVISGINNRNPPSVTKNLGDMLKKRVILPQNRKKWALK